MKQQQNRLYIFDFLRAISICLVIFGHLVYTGFDFPDYLLQNNYFLISVPAKIGLAMFFFISGYLIPLSVQKITVKQFAIRRFFRIVPVLFFTFIIALIIYKLFGYIRWNNPRDFNPGQMLSQILLIRDITGIGSVLSAEWSLLVEVKFYFIVALSYLYFKNENNRLIAIILFTLLFSTLFKIIKNDSATYFINVFSLLPGTFYFYLNKKVISFNQFMLLFIFSIIVQMYSLNIFTDYDVVNMHVLTGYLFGYLICFLSIAYINIKPNKII